MKLTPKAQKALRLLDAGPVCGQQMVEAGVGYAYAARIYELRGAGFDISTRRCENSMHRHRSALLQYELEPGQLSLLVGRS